MSVFSFFGDHPLVLGLTIGLCGVVFVTINGWLRLHRLKQYLQTHLTMTNKAHSELLKENEELKTKCANLEKSLAMLSQKASAAEKKTLLAYDQTLHQLFLKMPGFATAWEEALRETQAEMDKSDAGLKPLLTRIFHPSLFAASADSRRSAGESPTDGTDQTADAEVTTEEKKEPADPAGQPEDSQEER